MMSFGKSSLLVYILLARVVFSFQQWSIITILARSSNYEVLGLFALAISIVTPINALFNMGLRDGVATDLSGRFTRAEYWVMRLVTILVSILVIPMIASMFWDTPKLAPLLWAVLFVKTVDLIAELTYGFLQRHDRLFEISTSQILRSIMGTGSFAFVYFTYDDTVLAVCAWGISWIGVLVLYDLRTLRNVGEAFTARTLWENITGGGVAKTLWALFLVQIPFGVAAGIGNIGLVTPRLIFERVTTLEEFGVFTALIVIFQAGQSFVIAIMQAFLTPLARALQSEDLITARGLIRRLLLVFIAGGVFMVGVSAIFGAGLLHLLYGPDFSAYAWPFTILAAGWAVRYIATILRNVFTANRSFWTGAMLDTIGTSFTVVGCLGAVLYSTAMSSLAAGFLVGQLGLLFVVVIATAQRLR